MKVGVIGLGVVGSAVLKSFQEKGINAIGHDKYKESNSFEDMLSTQIVFLCLPTLYSEELHQYDKSTIHDVCSNLDNNDYSGLVVVKSTVEPETTHQLSEKYNLNLCHNPEFLTARTAYQDFHNQQHIMIGSANCDISILVNLYKEYYGDAIISECTSTESELMKIAVNNFYAVKVQFFNELYLLSKQMKDTDYDTVKTLMIKNGWINPMHTDVPGPDGKLSYGGMCFPKDTNALLHYMKYKDTPHKVLESVVNERNILRDD